MAFTHDRTYKCFPIMLSIMMGYRQLIPTCPGGFILQLSWGT
jgi:hypothetical protein